MTIGANGINVYEQLKNASLINVGLEGSYKFCKEWALSGKTSYRRGTSDNNLDLPFIQPFSYGTTLSFKHKFLTLSTAIEGAVKQRNFSSEFGETASSAYTIVNVVASYQFEFGQKNLVLKTGVENLFNRYYSTFADWNRIPRMGRNVFFNLILNLL